MANINLEEIGRKAQVVSRKLGILGMKEKNRGLLAAAQALLDGQEEILAANQEDMEKASMPHHFEHVDEYILENMDKFKTGTLQVAPEKNAPQVRLTVDTQEDYEKACYIASHSKTGLATTEEAIALCSQYA